MTFLKNYTSDVAVHVTIARIEAVLLRCRVSGITKEYGPNGEMLALIFHIPSPNGQPLAIRLPANEEAALRALWLDYVGDDKLSADGNTIMYNGRKLKKKAHFREQARRTAWKMMQDWIEVQMSMIQMQQADQLQVFLPYIWDSANQVSFYDRAKANGFRALLPEKTDS